MTIRNALISSTIAISCLAAAAYADAAKAGDNPYIPDPAPSTVGSYGPYCSIRPLGALWPCEAPDASANGYGEGNKLGLPAREGRHHVDPKPTPTCEPKSKA